MNYRRLIYFLSVTTGCILLLIGFAANLSFAQDDDPEYIGERECSDCHRDIASSQKTSAHVMALHEASEEGILADFAQGEDVRMVQFPDSDEARAFGIEDVAYVIGSGRYAQAFLYEIESDVYRVFPAEWNVAESSWQPLSLADSWDDPAYDWNTNCAGCHTTGYDTTSGEWVDEGVQCEACHGPGLVHVEAADDAGSRPSEEELQFIRDSIVLSPDAQICGQCHSRGTDGDFAFSTTYLPGQSLLESFTLASMDDPVHWWNGSHAKQSNMQFNEWLNSAHSSALSDMQSSDYADDSCLACHSTDFVHTQDMIATYESGDREGIPPEALTAETAEFGVTCLACHPAHQTEDQSILIADSYTLCTDCHSNPQDEIHHPVQEIFEGLPIVENVEPRASEHFANEEGPDCIACHMLEVTIEPSGERVTHSLQPVIPGTIEGLDVDSCTSCHDDLSPDYLGEFVTQAQEKVSTRLENANAALVNVESPPDWVETALAAVEGDGSLGVHNVSYTNALLDAVEIELGLVQTSELAGAAQPATDPSECAECHQDEHRQWQTSPHANASLNETFLQAHADQNRPGYCMSCHASGYDASTGLHEFEGVTCTSCHTTVTPGTEHPPAPLDVGDASAVCGQCHSGAHAPTYDEWLVSDHSEAGVDCIDCHTPHNNGLVLGDVNSTCGDCHQEALVDEVHMGQDMTCVECHMASHDTAQDGIQIVKTGHTMEIEPQTCSECHGLIHGLTMAESHVTDEERNTVASLEAEIEDLQEEADNNRNTGLIGGALSALLVLLGIFIIFRLRKLL